MVVPARHLAEPYHEAPVLDAAAIEERTLASQLAHLASQHHTSEYNRMKFGPLGAPVMYLPLSIQLPAHVRDLKMRQVYNSKRTAWWPAKSPESTHHGPPAASPPLAHTIAANMSMAQADHVSQYPSRIYSTMPENDPSCSKNVPQVNCLPTADLQHELSVAMSSSLSFIRTPSHSHQIFASQAQPHSLPQMQLPQPNLMIHAKTSESHPINISPIVPSDLLPLITSHLQPSAAMSSRLFDVPPTLHLHHLVFQAQPHPNTMRQYPFMRIPNGSMRHFYVPVNGAGPPGEEAVGYRPQGTPEPNFGTFQNHGIVDDRDNSEENANDNVVQDGPLFTDPAGRPASAPPSLDQARGLPAPSSFFQNMDAGMGMSPPLLPELVHAMSTELFRKENEKGLGLQMLDTGMNDVGGWGQDINTLNGVGSTVPEEVSPPSPLFPVLGNILLSSCPGKKVRLSGPVKGRGAICRDLGHDLRRIRSLGVGCIICCLDDEELELLGVSWSQYSEIAHAIGLDVLRIPIPEGLTPISPAFIDYHLTNIIHQYTLQGVPVLVHCRGGV
ncbi:hypothetical protein M422DRAFT_38650, partial [Sphaerobolus stellatus SS14]